MGKIKKRWWRVHYRSLHDRSFLFPQESCDQLNFFFLVGQVGLGKTREVFSPLPPFGVYLLHNNIGQAKVLTGDQGRVRRDSDDTEGKRHSCREFEFVRD